MVMDRCMDKSTLAHTNAGVSWCRYDCIAIYKA